LTGKGINRISENERGECSRELAGIPLKTYGKGVLNFEEYAMKVIWDEL